MTDEKRKQVNKVLDLMRDEGVSIKDISIVIAESGFAGDIVEVQKKIKGFLYPDANIIETQ